MILAMASDVRVVLVKLADRLHNMLTLEYLPEARRRRSRGRRSRSTLRSPTGSAWAGQGRARGPGVPVSRSPREYARIQREVEKSLKGSEKTIEQLRRGLEKKLKPRPASRRNAPSGVKRYYSICPKLRRRGVDVSELYDLLAFRIVTPETRDTYAALGLVHQRWRPVPGRFKDYIAMPKPNLYQSLHTTVMSEAAQPFEVQIRTREMDLVAERGIAAHWKYKEGKLLPHADDGRFQWLRQLVDWQSDVSDPRQFLSALKVDLYPDEVYTFTPKGEVFAFPRGATAVDFAYRVHTDVGNRCVGARVNGKLVPLRTPIARAETSSRS